MQSAEKWVKASFDLVREDLGGSPQRVERIDQLERIILHRLDAEEVLGTLDHDAECTPVEMTFRRARDLRPENHVIGVLSDQGSIKFGEYETVKSVEVEDDSSVVMIDFEDALALTVPLLAWAVILVAG